MPFKIAIISFSQIHRDARVLRQVEYLSKHFSVTVLGYGQLDPSLEGNAQMLPIQPPTSLARRIRKAILFPLGRIFPKQVYEAWYWSENEYKMALALLVKSGADVIHANDWESLPVAVRAAQDIGASVVLDLHEYAPLMRENRRYWRTFYKPAIDYFLRKCLPHISASVTVNHALAERYAKEYDIQPIVVMNVPRYTNAPQFRPTDSQQISLIHHGDATSDRKLELMIEALTHTDSRYTLHLMLVERTRGYISKLKTLAQRLASDRVFFHDPVRPTEIVERISEFDIGIFVLPSVEFNSKSALPNKFFEFVAAGLAVCIGPSPEMARLTLQFGFGKVAQSFEPIKVASILNSLSAADIDRMKLKAIEARKVLNADIELGKLVQLYSNLFAGEG